jgi:hypothetical protein
MPVITRRDLRWLRNDAKTRRDPNTPKIRRQLLEAMGWDNGQYGYNEAFDRSKQTLRPKDFSLRDMFRELVTTTDGHPIGEQLLESFSNRKHGRNVEFLQEAPVSTDAFVNTAGQIFYTSTLEAFQMPNLIGDKITKNVPTDLQGEEKIPGLSMPGDKAEAVGENEPYPEIGIGEEWIMTPEKIKNGFILSISKEAIKADRTGLLMDRANKGSEFMAINKEKRILDAALGITTLYRRNGGAAQATYGNTHTQGTFDNLSGDVLADWTDIEAALLLFDAIDDPNTGEPISLVANQLIVPSALLMTARRIQRATEVRMGDITAGAGIQTIGPNPLASDPAVPPFEILSNQYVFDRGASATAWWYGDFRRGFTYRENWPITTDEEREDGPRSFSHDTVLRLKTSEKGTPAVEEPRYAVQGNT